MGTKTKFDLEAMRAVSARASQEMTTSAVKEESKIKNPKGAGRKPATDPAKHKISVNLTDAELDKLNEYCTHNGMKPAAVLRYCLTKMDVL